MLKSNPIYSQVILTFLLSFLSCSSFAMEDETALATAAQSPLKESPYAKHISAPFEDDINFGYDAYSDTQNILNFKPVIPFRLTASHDLILRIITPIYERTPTQNTQGILQGHYVQGWGDINPTFFIAPTDVGIITWGIGPTFYLPTATNNRYIGTGKWSVGPELAIVAMPKNWVLGILTSNVWSVAGDSHRPAVDQLSFQYFVSYNFPSGWYLTTNPTITADWKKPGNQQWLVPFGVGVGRAFYWSQQPISLTIYAYYNAIRPATLGPNWQLQLNIEWLFKPVTLRW